MLHILLVSDNQDFAEDLKAQVSRFAPDLSFVENKPDLLIVDDDKEKMLELRQNYPSIPLVFLSSEQPEETDNLNIFVKKPFSLACLLDVLRAANNKLDNSVDGYLFFNDYELRPNKKEIVDLINKRVVKLTEKEINVLKYLYKTKDDFVSKNDLQRNVWKYNEDVTTHTIETHIYRLRQKVEKEGGRRLIITDNGGYKLQ